jgi:hypothetical protein
VVHPYFAAFRLSFRHAPYTLGMGSVPSTTETGTWLELFRSDDLLQARAVATCVAAMEFDVRLISAAAIRSGTASGSDLEDDFPGPYVIEVPAEDIRDLASVLREIIEEQREFDDRIATRHHRRQLKLLLILGSAGVVEVLVIWRLMDA